MKKPNYSLPVLVCLLSLLGVVFVFEASGKIKYLFEQLGFFLVGLLLMIFFSRYNFNKFRTFSLWFILFSFVLLIIVLIPGIGVKIYGARRWINLIWFSFQPSELLKLSVIIFLSHWFENQEKNRHLAFFILISFIIFLLMLQPDMGTSIIIFLIAMTLFFVSKSTDLKKFLLALPVIIMIICILIFVSPYRLERLLSFINPGQVIPENYHQRQALISVGSGGLFGVGLGKSKQKYAYLPESSSDSIFGIIAEELGFVGTSFILFLYYLLIRAVWRVTFQTKENFPRFLSCGIAAFFTAQIFINLSSMLSLTPFTGVPLLFISSGGSALLIQFIAVGIILNISKP